MDKITRILLIDDDEEQFMILKDLLKDAQNRYIVEWDSWANKSVGVVADFDYDACIIDYDLGSTNGIDVIKSFLSQGYDKPLILMTGQGDHNLDMEALELGAADYINKNDISPEVLERSIRYSIKQKQLEAERDKLISSLETALLEVKTLTGLLPICASCKKIRDDQGYWQRLEDYICEHTDAEFTHGVCPDCAKELYP